MRVCARWPPTFQVPFFVPAGGSSATPAFGAPSQLGGGAPAFGAASAPTPADTPASPFGAAPAASPFGAATPAPSPFAAAAAPASSPFGAAAPAASPFGVAAPAASPFGAAPAASAFGASQVWAAQLARGAKKNLSHRVCGRGRFDGTGLRCSIRTRWRPSIWFYFRTWRRPCVWGCTVSIGVWHTLPTRRNISFRYVRVSAHIIPRPGPTTVRVLLFTGGKGVFGAAQGGGAFAAPSGGGGGFASYAPQAASGGFGALAQAGGSAPAPSFGGHR